jgi:hypothetical protein
LSSRELEGVSTSWIEFAEEAGTGIQNKLSIWAKLYKQCEQLELRLRSTELLEGDATAPAWVALRQQYLALKAAADAALKEASER